METVCPHSSPMPYHLTITPCISVSDMCFPSSAFSWHIMTSSLLFALLPRVFPFSASKGVCAMQNKTGYKPPHATGEKANAGCRAARWSGNAAPAPGLCIVEPHSTRNLWNQRLKLLHTWTFITLLCSLSSPSLLPHRQNANINSFSWCFAK